MSPQINLKMNLRIARILKRVEIFSENLPYVAFYFLIVLIFRCAKGELTVLGQ